MVQEKLKHGTRTIGYDDNLWKKGGMRPGTTFDRATGSVIYRILIRGSLSYNL